jgi:hypothetical protein
MRKTLLALMLLGAVSVPAAADDQNGRRGRQDRYEDRIPPGHLPPPGECRVWYPGVPPGHQPPPFKCDDRDRYDRRSDGRYDRDDRYGRDERDYGGYERERRADERYEDRREDDRYDREPERRSGRTAKPRYR